jgi:hypothetical protein
MRMVAAYLDPKRVQSTWLGNKTFTDKNGNSRYRQVIILAPGIASEDGQVDKLIRVRISRDTPSMKAMEEARSSVIVCRLCYLIHGSSEGRFKVTYCPQHLTQRRVSRRALAMVISQQWKQTVRYRSSKDGWNTDDEGRVLFSLAANSGTVGPQSLDLQ